MVSLRKIAPTPWPDRFLPAGVWVVIAGGALVFSGRTSAFFSDPKWLATGLLVALFLVIYAWNWRLDARRPASAAALLGIAAMAAGILLAAVLAPEKLAALYGLPFFLIPLAWGAMILTVPWTERDLGILLQALVALGALVALIGLGQYYAPVATAELLGYGSAADQGRSAIYSTIGNPEYLGGFLAPLAMLSLADLWRQFRRAHPLMLLQGFAFLLMIWAILLTEARGAWLACLVGGGFLLVCLWASRGRLVSESPTENAPDSAGKGKSSRKQKDSKPAALQAAAPACRWAWKWGIAGAVLLVILLVALPTPLNPHRVNLARRFAQSADLSSAAVQQRLLLYIVTADMIRTDGWIGVGPNNFAPRFALHLQEMRNRENEGAILKIAWRLGNYHPGYVHCEPLQFWVESGLLGIGGFLLVVAASFTLIWRGLLRRAAAQGGPSEQGAIRDSARAQVDVRLFALAAGYSAAWLCGLAASLLSFPFHMPDRAFLYWGLMGLSLAAIAMVQTRRAEAPNR